MVIRMSWLGCAIAAAVLALAASASAQNVTLTGFVQDGGGAPIEGATVTFTDPGDVVADSDVSAANGSFTLMVPPGMYITSVTPPIGSSFEPQESPDFVTITTSMSFNFVLVEPAATEIYSGTVRDRASAGVSGIAVRIPGAGGDLATTDSAGAFSLQATATTHQLRIDCSGGDTCFGASEDAHLMLDLPEIDLSAGSLTGQVINLPNRVLSGTITDFNGAPVANAEVVLSVQVSYGAGAVTGFLNERVFTNAAGQYSVLAFPGAGNLDVTPEEGSGLLYATTEVTIPDQVGDPANVDVELEEEVLIEYSGVVRDRASAGVMNMVVRMPGSGGDIDTTDATGAFTLNASPTLHMLRVDCGGTNGCFGSSGLIPHDARLPERELTGPIPNAVLNVAQPCAERTITDPEGAHRSRTPASTGVNRFSPARSRASPPSARSPMPKAITRS